MAKIGAVVEYVPPVKEEKDNPFVADLQPIAEKGIDTLFTVEFDADEYSKEKLLIQEAMNKLGFSARVHESDYDADSGQRKVKTTFRVRPMRKRKGEAKPVEDTADSDD